MRGTSSSATSRRADRGGRRRRSAEFGVATVHEAQGRTGLLDPRAAPDLRRRAHRRHRGHGQRAARRQLDDPRRRRAVPARATCSWSRRRRRPRPATSASCSRPRCAARGVRGVVIDAGCRDVAELTADGLPGLVAVRVARSARVKETLGSVNVPVVCAGQLVEPGRRGRRRRRRRRRGAARAGAAEVLEASRGARGEGGRAPASATRAGELGLDMHGMRERLAAKGLVYVDARRHASMIIDCHGHYTTVAGRSTSDFRDAQLARLPTRPAAPAPARDQRRRDPRERREQPAAACCASAAAT